MVDLEDEKELSQIYFVAALFKEGRKIRVKIVCLLENTVGNEKCETEHGLSIYVETGDKKLLIDTGASGLFLKNAKKLGIDLSRAEAVFISHGHYDHTGGILEFAQVNSKADIFLQEKALGNYWHIGKQIEKYIGMNPEVADLPNLHFLNGDYRYKDEIFVLQGKFKEKLKCWPEGNYALKEQIGKEYIQDDFSHEQYIVLQEEGKSVLISGCAHNGILNILDLYRQKLGSEPQIVISGFHMRKKEGYTKKDYEIIEETARALAKTNMICYTGHCTGEEPYQRMKKIMGEQLHYLHCGDEVIL